jgi:S-adenosylmethionine synthetase
MIHRLLDAIRDWYESRRNISTAGHVERELRIGDASQEMRNIFSKNKSEEPGKLNWQYD